MALTDAETLGVGLDFTQYWDVDVTAGSIGQVDGIANLEKDLAWSLMQAAAEEELRGRRFSPELREDTRIVVRRVATADSRIRRIEDITVSDPDDTRKTVEVQLTIIATTDERGEFVFTV